MANLQLVPAAAARKNNVEAQYVEMMVPLYSYGCERKVKKALAHIKGIYSVNVDFNQQKVTVWGICNKYDVLETMRSKRKQARFWNNNNNNNPEEEDDQDQEEDKYNNNIKNVEDDEPEESSASKEVPTTKARDRHMRLRPSLSLSLSLIKSRSLDWRSWKKVFIRSYSF